MQRFHYIRSLDGLRAIAVIAVILVHFSYRFFPGGTIGVDIFFVLSGFLITSVLKEELNSTGTIGWRGFYLRRILRLWPALWVMAVIVTLASVFTRAPAPHPGGDLLGALTFTMNFVRILTHTSDLSPLGHTWSLAVEDQFYLVWPFCLMALMSLPARWRWSVALTALVAAELWKFALAAHQHGTDRLSYGSDTRADQLLMGCLIGLRWGEKVPRLWSAIASCWPLACAFLVAILWHGESRQSTTWAVQSSLSALAGAVLIIHLSHRPSSVLARILSKPTMVYVGKLSYSLYLWHYALLLLVRVHNEGRILAACTLAGAVLVAAASYHFVELPMLRLKRRFTPPERAPEPQSAMMAPVAIAPQSVGTMAD